MIQHSYYHKQHSTLEEVEYHSEYDIEILELS